MYLLMDVNDTTHVVPKQYQKIEKEIKLEVSTPK